MQGKKKGKGKWKDKGKKRKKGPYCIFGGDHFKKECPNRNRKNEKGRNGGNTKLLGNSANTIEEDNDYAFTVEETSDDKRSINTLKGYKRELHTGTNKIIMYQLPIVC